MKDYFICISAAQYRIFCTVCQGDVLNLLIMGNQSRQENGEIKCETQIREEKLNRAKMLVVKNAFNLYPLTSGKQQHTAWILCEKAIDESSHNPIRRVL